MSERDEYRERIQAKLDRARRITPPTSEDNWDQGYIGGLSEVLAEYDRLAPERERAQRALQVFEEAAKHGPTDYGCDDTQPLCPLYDYCHWACGAQMLTRLGRDMGILPEEAK